MEDMYNIVVGYFKEIFSTARSKELKACFQKSKVVLMKI